jgi:hypothetical protein
MPFRLQSGLVCAAMSTESTMPLPLQSWMNGGV